MSDGEFIEDYSYDQDEKQFNQNQSAHARQECEEKLKDALDYMVETSDGRFDFSYSCRQSLEGCQQIKQLIKSVYLRYDCPDCSRERSDRQRRWTSIAGLIKIKFGFKKVTDEDQGKTVKLLVFKLKIYGMKCEKCKRYGQAQIYDSQLQKIEDSFCELVANVLNLLPAPPRERRSKHPKKVPYLRNHRSNLCEACALGIHQIKRNQHDRSRSRGRDQNRIRIRRRR